MKTSITDFDEYKKFCKEVAENDEIFNSFRRNEMYSVIVENVTREQGQAYLYYINKHMKDFELYRDRFQTSDLIGGPKLEDYGEDGIWCPTTLRYVKVLVELEEYFGGLDSFDIVEIGGGYGGQCKIIKDKNLIYNYTIFDLEETNLLILKYLNRLNYDDVRTETFVEKIESDLVISNYSFSELNIKVQENYISKVLNNSSRGYITFNNISKEHAISSMSEKTFRKYIKSRGGFCIEEFPKTHENNFIGIWGI